jgi:cobalamin synthase
VSHAARVREQAAAQGGRLRRLVSPYFADDAEVAADAIYGVVLVTAVIVASSLHGGSVGSVLAVSAVSVLVFWVAHVYSTMLVMYAHHGHSFAQAARHAAREEIGMLQATVLPMAFLAAGALGLLEGPRAVWAALWSGVAVLVAVPMLALRRRGRPWGTSILAGLGAGTLGLVLVGLKALLH